MKTSKLKRAIVMLLAITMLLTSTGMASFAESMAEGRDGNTEAVVTEAGSEALEAAAEEVAAEIADEEVPEAAPSESTEPAGGQKEEAKAALTAKDWEAGLPDDISKDVREAMAQVAKSQLKEEGVLYKAFANAESLDNWDASFVMFVLEYANVLGVRKAIGDESKGTVDKDNISVPVNADTDKWIKALKDKGLFTEIGEEAAPQQGDIVFTEDGAAVVIDVEDLTVIGAHNNNVEKFKADAEKVSGFVSLKDIAPAEFKDEEQAEEPAEEADEEATEAEELTEEELAAKKAEEEAAAKAAEEAAKAEEEARRIEEENLTEQTVDAELTAAPGIGGKLRSLFTSENGTEIKLSGYLPEDATVKAYPVKVEIPGQNVLAAYDITIYVKDADGNDVEWQPAEPLNVSITSGKLENAKAVSIYHMDNKDAEAELIDDNVAKSGNVAFDAERFSVYVVTETKPHLVYKFLNSGAGMDGDEYLELRQILYDGQSLVRPADPTDHGRKFVKWVAVDSETQAVSDADAEFADWDEKDVDEDSVDPDTKAEIRLLKAVFVEPEAQIHVTYYDQNGSVIRRDTLSEGTQIDPNGTADENNKVSYSALQVEAGEYLTFRWWTEDLYIYETDASKTESYGKPVKYEASNITSDIDLYPYCGPAHWLRFDGNKRKSDADITRPSSVPYIGAELVFDGDIPSHTDYPDNVAGYTFDGWYFKSADINDGYTNGKIYDASGNLVQLASPDSDGHTTAFEHYLYTGGNSLDYDPTLYAHWTQNPETTYSVVYYAMKPDVDPDKTPDPEEDYIFLSDKGTRSANTGDEVTRGDQDTVANAFSNADDLKGFVLSTDNNPTVTVRSDGSSVLRVYFDRKVQNLVFVDYAIRRSGSDNRGWEIPTDAALTKTNYSGNIKSFKSETVTARYGSYIGDKFPVFNGITSQGYYLSSSTATSISTGNSTNTLTYSSWWDADGSSLSRDYLFKRMEYMPALNNKTSEYFIHNNVSSKVRDIYYYLEVLPGTECSPGAGTSGNEYVYNPTSMYSWTGNATSNTASSYEAHSFTYQRLGSSLGFGTGGISDGNFQNIKGFTQQAVTPKPYDSHERDNIYFFYTRNSYQVTLKCKLDGRLTEESVADDSLKFKYEQPISEDMLPKFEHENTTNIRNDADAWWFLDEACTEPVNFETFTMPDHPITLYEGLRTAYPVAIDPAGGVLDGSNGSTWFSVDVGEAVSEYKVSRDYVLASEIGDTLEAGEGYVYRYSNDLDDLQYGVSPRTATYIEAAEGEPGQYVYYPGAWTFQYWYKVTATFDNDTETFILDEQPTDKNKAYDFSTKVTGPVYLKAKWLREGTYTVQYDAGDARAPHDSNAYVEGAQALILPSVDRPNGKQFRFWSTEEQGSKSISQADQNKIYKPNSSMTILNALAPVDQANQVNKTITLYAWYEDGEFTPNHLAEYRFYVQKSDGNGGYAWFDNDSDADGNFPEGHTPYYIQTISPEEQLIMPTTPTDPDTTRNGEFIGWFTDRACTQRFDGFGNIGTPENTRLYASFARVYSVTFKDESGSTITTVQTYSDGDRLDVRNVQYATENEKYVAFWSTIKNDSISNPAGTTVAYQGKGGRFGANADYTGDMTFYPILGDAHTLSFDSQGGSYVAPIEMPRKVNRYLPAPDDPVRQGYIFKGWWTEPQPDTASYNQGGVEYLFDRTLEQFTTENSLESVPVLVYAHWQVNELDPPKTTITVNYWIQDTDRSSYFLWDSELISDVIVGSSYTLPTSGDDSYISKDKIKGYYTFTKDAEGDTDNANDDRPYFLDPSTASQTIKYRDANGDVQVGTTTTVQLDGKTVYDVYYDRKTYTLNFNPYWTKNVNNQKINYNHVDGVGNTEGWNTVSKNISYVYRGKIDGTYYTADNPYSVEVWLGKNVAEEWPAYVDLTDNYFNYNNTSNLNNPYFDIYSYSVNSSGETVKTLSREHYVASGWQNQSGIAEESWLRDQYAFSSWIGTGLKETYNSPAKQVFIGKNLIPATENATATFEMKLDESHANGKEATIDVYGIGVPDDDIYQHLPKPLDDEATVHYLVPMSYNSNGTVAEWTELTSYKQTLHGVTGTGSLANWRPDNPGLAKVMGERLTINGYEYDVSGAAWTSEEQNETKTVTKYKYRMPDSNPIDGKSNYGNYKYYHKWGSAGALIYKAVSLRQDSEWVNKGEFVFVYRNLLNTGYQVHRDSDGLYRADKSIDEFWVDAFNTTGMSTSDLRDEIVKNFYTTKEITETYSGKHVYLHYIPQSYPLVLRSTEDENWKPSGDNGDGILVPYGSYLTNEDGSHGYIHDTLKVNAPNVVGKEFSNWAVSSSATSAYEGTMPDRKLWLYAHYVDKQVTVTAQGVTATGNVNRESEADDQGWYAPKTDDKDVLESWGENADFARAKKYNTQLMEYELPRPTLAPNEAFYGWKRVLFDNDGHATGLAAGYVSGSTYITADTVLVPDIRYNKSGYVEYNGNGNTGGTVPEQEGGYYLGGSVRAKSGQGLVKTMTVDGHTYTLKFVCWNTEADGSGIDYYPGDIVALPAKGTTTLYAKYSGIRSYKLVYHLNNTTEGSDYIAVNSSDSITGITGEGSNKIVTVEFPEYDENSNNKEYPNTKYPAAVDKNKKPFTALRVGYTLLGWNSLAAGGEDTRILSTDTIRVNSIDADSDNAIHIYAEWEQDKIPVKAFKEVFDDDPVMVTGSDGDMTTNELHTWTSAQFETAYRAVKTYDDPVAANYSFRNVVVKNTKTSAETEAAMVRYALSSDGLGYVWQYKAVGASDNEYTTLTDKDVIELRYTATYSLTIDNVVDMTGAYSSTSDKFDIAVTFTHANGDPVTEQEATAAGITYKSKIDGAASEETAVDASASVITVTLQHNGQAIIDNVPAGWKYSIVETKDNGYTVSYAASATGQLSGNTTVTITNKRDTIVPSGIEKSNSILIPLFLTLLLALGVILSIIQRRRLASRTR